jgi:hypothetical protein
MNAYASMRKEDEDDCELVHKSIDKHGGMCANCGYERQREEIVIG